MKKLLYLTFSVALVMFLSLSCGKNKPVNNQESDDILVTFADSSLRVSEVVRRIPSGLSVEDSTSLFNKIVDQWVLEMVLTDYAEKNISDMSKIDKMVEEYRNNLIVTHYLQSMSESSAKDIPEDKIKKYYEINADSMILEQPLVKGIFLKVSENDESLPNLRKWFASFNDEALDKIEKSGLRRALQYKYFKDEWVEWNMIADQIPYRFFDADAFLRSTKNFETIDEAGSVYLLHISEYVPSGEKMPYEYARIKIADILQSSEVSLYRKKLINDIYNKRIKDGLLKPGLYDPVKK